MKIIISEKSSNILVSTLMTKIKDIEKMNSSFLDLPIRVNNKELKMVFDGTVYTTCKKNDTVDLVVAGNGDDDQEIFTLKEIFNRVNFYYNEDWQKKLDFDFILREENQSGLFRYYPIELDINEDHINFTAIKSEL